MINQLFEGHTYNYVQCVNVEYKSDRTESFMDLQLDVKGCKDIYASFDKYTEEEMLEGQNQYKAEGHGMQVGEEGSSGGACIVLPKLAVLLMCALLAPALQLYQLRC